MTLARRSLVAAALALAAAACAHAPPAVPAPSGRSSATWGIRSGAQRPGAIVGEYDLTWRRETSSLVVEARFGAKAGGLFRLERGAERFVRDAAAAPDREGAPFTPMTLGEDGVLGASACAKGPCRVRYRFLLGEAAKRLDDVDSASDEGEIVEAPPSTFVLVPAIAERDLRVRFRVHVPEGQRFVTGVFRSEEANDAWDITLDDLWSSPYSAFGPMRTFDVEANGATVQLAVGPGKLAVTDAELALWTSNAARAVSGYFGRFPMRSALVLVVVADGRWVGGGRTLAGGGGTVFMRLGEEATKRELDDDWVLVHEMIHLTIPSLPPSMIWAEEGLATYTEPWARVRAGMLSESTAWASLFEGLPNGLPQAGDRGLDHTSTWGRTYWGGALFWLLADVEIRKKTANRLGLEHAMRGILAAGGNNASRWSLDDTLAAGDRATGTTVLRDLHAAMGSSPHPVDLADLAKSLGVAVSRGRARFDDAAPLATVRKAITKGTDPATLPPR
ncbi:MAG: hypothetical protein JST00_44520 [Deltaproteobacteria bacterium]|nr:hypothetical protein [Deltaproteobacteria bacterium]